MQLHIQPSVILWRLHSISLPTMWRHRASGSIPTGEMKVNAIFTPKSVMESLCGLDGERFLTWTLKVLQRRNDKTDYWKILVRQHARLSSVEQATLFTIGTQQLELKQVLNRSVPGIVCTVLHFKQCESMAPAVAQEQQHVGLNVCTTPTCLVTRQRHRVDAVDHHSPHASNVSDRVSEDIVFYAMLTIVRSADIATPVPWSKQLRVDRALPVPRHRHAPQIEQRLDPCIHVRHIWSLVLCLADPTASPFRKLCGRGYVSATIV
ncbi:MAG: hypothetical protein WA040_00170 [Anaerolineae bacterium]